MSLCDQQHLISGFQCHLDRANPSGDQPRAALHDSARQVHDHLLSGRTCKRNAVKGITVNPALSKVTETDSTLNLEGGGKVSVGQQTISYTHKGKVAEDQLNLDITVTVIPMIVEPKIVFKGKKK